MLGISPEEVPRLVQAQYAATQALHELRETKTVRVFRGVRRAQAAEIRRRIEAGATEIEFSVRSLSSFSTSREAAESFTDPYMGIDIPKKGEEVVPGLILEAEIPVSRVFIDARTNRIFDAAQEDEVAVLSETETFTVKVEDIQL